MTSFVFSQSYWVESGIEFGFKFSWVWHWAAIWNELIFISYWVFWAVWINTVEELVQVLPSVPFGWAVGSPMGLGSRPWGYLWSDFGDYWRGVRVLCGLACGAIHLRWSKMGPVCPSKFCFLATPSSSWKAKNGKIPDHGVHYSEWERMLSRRWFCWVWTFWSFN